MNSDFQKYWFTNVKMNAFQSWMHFYSFIVIAWSISLYAFKFKNNISFFCALWILQFKILNRKCSFSIQLHPIESNWIQLNPIKSKKSIRYLKYAFGWKIRKKFQSILIHSRLLGDKYIFNLFFYFLRLIILLYFANTIMF